MALKGAAVVVTGATGKYLQKRAESFPKRANRLLSCLAAGTVGSGIVQRFLQEGAWVVAPLRSAASKRRLTDHLEAAPTDKLHTPVADWSTEAGAAELAKFVKEAGLQLDHVVSVAGGMAPPGNVADITPALVQEAVTTKVVGHVLLAQALLPLMRQQATSSWTVITGMLGEVCMMPGVALTCISNSAVFGLVKVLQFESKDSPLRVNELRIASIIRRDSEAQNEAFPGVPAAPASKVGALLAGIATGQQRDEVIRVSAEDLDKVPAFAG